MNRHFWTRLCSVFFVKSLLPRIVAGAHTLHAAPLTNREQKNLLQRKKMHRAPSKSSFAGVLLNYFTCVIDDDEPSKQISAATCQSFRQFRKRAGLFVLPLLPQCSPAPEHRWLRELPLDSSAQVPKPVPSAHCS
jgi:hypothetical protein